MFDVEIWGVRKGHCQDQVNAIALLGRLELEGLSAGDRWTDIADHVTPHALDGISPFLDLHYIYALARAGRDAMAEQLAATRPGGELAAGMMAHARGRYAEASLAFGAGRKQLRSIGGSQVQREWFDRLFIDSLARAGSERRLYA